MITITNAHAAPYARKHFTTFASDANIPPGPPPRSLPTLLGDGVAFELQSATEHEFHYRQPTTHITLTVFND